MTGPFVRTVLGDVAADQLGVCYAHEHIIIDDSVATLRFPDFCLPSVENAITELTAFYANGGRAMVDSMPCDAGRNVEKLAAVSRATGVHIICPTGLHLPKYYDEAHWGARVTLEELARLFVDDIVLGIDALDYSGPVVRRTAHRAGVIKIASSGGPLTVYEQTVFKAAALAHRRTGSPILTHTEQGKGALEQADFLASQGVDLQHVVLSHTDRNPDVGYHREVLSTGVCVEYDSAFRWKDATNPTLDLLCQLLPEFPKQVMLGMDAARPTYWKSYGGGPGLSFLLKQFTGQMTARGITRQQWRGVFIENPGRTYSFADVAEV